jgi:hypothetical protein
LGSTDQEPQRGQLVGGRGIRSVNWSSPSLPHPRVPRRSTGRGPTGPFLDPPPGGQLVHFAFPKNFFGRQRRLPPAGPRFIPSPTKGSTGRDFERDRLVDPQRGQLVDISVIPRRNQPLGPSLSPSPLTPKIRSSVAYRQAPTTFPSETKWGRSDHRRAYTQLLVRTSLLDNLHDPVVQLGRLQRIQSPLRGEMTIRRRPAQLFRYAGNVDLLRCVARGLFVSDYDVRVL